MANGGIGLIERRTKRPSTWSIHEMYGTEPGQASFANNCLLARRLVERGVRFVQLYHWGWDMHGASFNNDIVAKLPRLCRETDRAVAALLTNLKQHRLLDSTILHLMGLDHTKLTCKFQGREFRLTDVHGNVVRKLLA